MRTTSLVGTGEDLSRFRFHTGATLRPVTLDEPCRLLFRDIGPVAMALFLRGRLKRLAGPFAPILYTRTAEYREPYVDHAPVGRLVFLQPKLLRPWHSGVPSILVASLQQQVDAAAVGFVPASMDLGAAEEILQGVNTVAELREVFGGKVYDQVIRGSAASLERLNADHAATEKWAEPMRRNLQSRDRAIAEAARAWLDQHRLTESDLCTAWHRLPGARRELLKSLGEEVCGC